MKLHGLVRPHCQDLTRLRYGTAAFCAAALVGATLTGGTAQADVAGGNDYTNAHNSTSARVEDLLRRMTLPEKIGQMDQTLVGGMRDASAPANGTCTNAGGNNDPLQQTCIHTVVVKNYTGSILVGGTDNPPGNTGADWAAFYNQIQHTAVESFGNRRAQRRQSRQ